MDEPTVWRLHSKPGGAANPSLRTALVAAMLKHGFVATGWHVEGEPKTQDEYVSELARQRPGEKWQASKAFALKTRAGDLVWVVDLHGCYHLARVCGDWHYELEDCAYGIHAVNRFACKWITDGLISSDVPSGVKNSFYRPRSFQKIGDQAAVRFSARLAGSQLKQDPRAFISLIDHEALEDLVGIFLQKKLNGFIIPSSGKRSNSAYEFVIGNWNNDRRAIVQVKSGDTAITDTLSSIDADRFLFALNGKYPEALDGAFCVNRDELINFALENPKLMPSTIRTWM